MRDEWYAYDMDGEDDGAYDDDSDDMEDNTGSNSDIGYERDEDVESSEVKTGR